jgi:flagellar protein FlbT
MPLKIQIKSGQQIIINGAVLENASPRTVSLLVKNEAAILRDKDILTADDAQTPASRVYYTLQCVYLFPGEKERYLDHFADFISAYLDAVPSSEPTVEAIRGMVDSGQYYSALKKTQDLITQEGEILARIPVAAEE